MRNLSIEIPDKSLYHSWGLSHILMTDGDPHRYILVNHGTIMKKRIKDR
jgi:hypothetical protein